MDNVFRDTIDSEPSIIYSFLKRAIDIGGAVLGIVILTPVLIILGLLIKLEDPKASIFFIQERVGNRGKLFRMYKFRSMIVNAEDLLANLLVENEVTGAMFKMKNDPRVTKIGRFIRKTSLDEIPQLINVIKGEMSLVGPRPPLPREVMLYEEKHFQRLTVKPGCTGLWQVTARNEVGFEEMVNLDLLYIKERTLLLDIKLILKTIQVMVLKKGI
ncbi:MULTISPECIES: sugar transferase [Exiguobacterium]|uniref:sugar transferase n=1 Tax=Exiguobacterium TaxID=33986 RepID=UPI0021AF2A6B|nr:MULTISPECIES: sugar transferase [Exiguobacterium]MCT4777081.1 sugar transferase [Exiguobacterium aquaticum]MCT4789859.1 sugar transferase [Exiguobacterium mexicanum]